MPISILIPKQSEVISKRSIIKVRKGARCDVQDCITVEEPLEIRIKYNAAHGVYRTVSLAVTMRTPGHDEELVLGFLLTEGIVRSFEDIKDIQIVDINIAEATMVEALLFDADRHKRNFYVTSSCGVCGKAAIEHIESDTIHLPWKSKFSISEDLLLQLPQNLRNLQQSFAQTGGIHACALVTQSGQISSLREDVGRHNAMDKLLGANPSFPLSDSMVLLSGRASFELIQKAVKAGIGMVCAIGAPSSLAIELAEGHGITLVGFLKDSGYNIYCGTERIKVQKITV